MGDVMTAIRLKRQAEHYALYGWSYAFSKTDEELAAAYNGIGPEWFPQALRTAIDAMHPDLLVVAFIHDVMWAYSDGTREMFDISNDFFEKNGRIIADEKYAWYDPRRYIRRRQARLFADLCRDFGWGAYKSAYNKQKEA